jgi:hypothetical protein
VIEGGRGGEMGLESGDGGGPGLIMSLGTGIVEGGASAEKVAYGFPLLATVGAEIGGFQANGSEEAPGGVLSGTELIPHSVLGTRQQGGGSPHFSGPQSFPCVD